MLSKLMLTACLIISSSAMAVEKAKQAPKQVLFKNVHVWDGKSEGITKKIHVLVENNLIKKVWATKSDAHPEAIVIESRIEKYCLIKV